MSLMRIMLVMVSIVLLLSGVAIGVGAGQQPTLNLLGTAVDSDGAQAEVVNVAVEPVESAAVDDEAVEAIFVDMQATLDKTAVIAVAADPDSQDQPVGDEPPEAESETRQSVNELLAGVQALLASAAVNQAVQPPLDEDPAIELPDDLDQEPYPGDIEHPPLEEPQLPPEDEAADPAGEDAAEPEEETSPAQQMAADLMAGAQALIERLTGAKDAEQAEPTLLPETAAEDGETGSAGLMAQVQGLLAQLAGMETVEDPTAVQEWMPNTPDCDAEPAPGVNWSGCDKSGIELDGANLQAANLMDTNFSGAYLTNVDMSGAHLGGAIFSGAELSSVLLRMSVLTGADFSGALLFFVDMSHSDLSGADFSDSTDVVVLANNSKFNEANFSRAILLYTDYSQSQFGDALFNEAQVYFSYFRESMLRGANFTSAPMAVVDFSGAALQGMDLSKSSIDLILFKESNGEPISSIDLIAAEVVCPDGSLVAGTVTSSAADLCSWAAPAPPMPVQAEAFVTAPDCGAPAAPGVNWDNCDFSGITLNAADLRGASLIGTNFSGATIGLSDLRGADMSDAIFSGATLYLSDLSGSILRGAAFDGAKMDGVVLANADMDTANLAGLAATFVNMQRSSLSEVDMSGAVIVASTLNYANMSEVTAAGASIYSSFLRGVNLIGTDAGSVSMELTDLSEAQIEGLDLSADTLVNYIWFKNASGTPTSSQDLALDGTLICPAGDAIFGPLTTDAASLCAWEPCWDGIEDGSFEAHSDAWYLPATEYTAEYSQDQANSPTWSVRTGIVLPDDNTFSFSSVRQKVVLPAGSSAATLTFYLYPQTDEPSNMLIPTSIAEAQSAMNANTSMGGAGSNIGDAQWVIIFDDMGRQLMRPVSMRSNAQSWQQYAIDLGHLVSPHQDRTIEIYFGTFNNGYEGVTSMYVDDVQLGSCAGVPPPPPPEPPPQLCSEAVINGGFEVKDDSWLLPLTPRPADYSDVTYNNGVWSMRTGINDPAMANEESFSSALQRVTIPAEATEATLAFYLNPQSTESTALLIPESIAAVLDPGARAMAYGDAQWVMLLNQKGEQLARLVSMRSDAQTWSPFEFDLLPYKGHTILLYFGSYNNGIDGRTAMFVDDVSLQVCTPEEVNGTLIPIE